MAVNGGRRTSAPGNNSSLILGILIGMVVGLAIAGAVAWHISQRPAVFVTKDQHEKPPAPVAAPETPKQKPAAPAVQPATVPASGVGNGQPRFEFYEILTDKKQAAPKGSGHSATSTSTAPKETAKLGAATSYFLQAGSFSSADEADKLKAKLAFLNMEASVQKAEIPGKGTHYRVRLGPFHSTGEMNKVNATLKSNGISDAAPVRAQ